MKSSIIHLYLYGRIKQEAMGSKTIHISKIHPIVKWAVRLPRKYQREVVQELIHCGYLKQLGRDTYEIPEVKRIPPCDSLGEPLW